MEDDGGCIMTDKVNQEIKSALLKVVTHLQNAHGITAKKVRIYFISSFFFLSFFVLFLMALQSEIEPWSPNGLRFQSIHCHYFPILNSQNIFTASPSELAYLFLGFLTCLSFKVLLQIFSLTH